MKLAGYFFFLNVMRKLRISEGTRAKDEVTCQRKCLVLSFSLAHIPFVTTNIPKGNEIKHNYTN